MKNYIQRLRQGCPVGVHIFWWILRLLTLYALVVNCMTSPMDIALSIELAVGFVCMFLWEMCMATPKTSFTIHMPSFLQTISATCIFASLFFGKFLGLYDAVFWAEPAAQFIFGAVSIFVGYEIACTFIKRDKHYATKAMAFFVSFGLFFITLNVVELSEFFIDQLVGIVTGEPANTQSWSYELAQSTSRSTQIIPAIASGRWAIMDIMTDIILSTIGAFFGLLIVNIFPYRHKGKYKYDFDFGKQKNKV